MICTITLNNPVMSERLYLFDTDEDENEVQVIVEYRFDRTEPETGYGGGWDVLKIKYGRQKYTNIEDFTVDYPDCGQEIESKLEDLFEEDANRSAWDHDWEDDEA